MTTALDTAASPAPTPQRYRLGLLGISLLDQAAAGDSLAVSALAVRAHREGGLPAPLTPSRLPQHLSDARAWLEIEAEAGRDITPPEVAAAFAALTAAAAPAAPVGETVFRTPSPS